MSGNAKFRWFLLAPALLCFLSACASTGTIDNTSSTLQTNTSREVRLEGEERECEWELEYRKGPGELLMECNDYSGEPRVQGYELCPPGWHDKFVASSEMRKIQRVIDAVAREKKLSIENQEFEKAAELRDKEEGLRANLEKEKDNWEGDNGEVYSEGESRNKEQVRSGICLHSTDVADYVKNMIAEGIRFDHVDKAPTEVRQCKAGRGCRRAIRCEQCLLDLENVYWADSHGEGASWYPCDMC